MNENSNHLPLNAELKPETSNSDDWIQLANLDAHQESLPSQTHMQKFSDIINSTPGLRDPSRYPMIGLMDLVLARGVKHYVVIAPSDKLKIYTGELLFDETQVASIFEDIQNNQEYIQCPTMLHNVDRLITRDGQTLMSDNLVLRTLTQNRSKQNVLRLSNSLRDSTAIDNNDRPSRVTIRLVGPQETYFWQKDIEKLNTIYAFVPDRIRTVIKRRKPNPS